MTAPLIGKSVSPVKVLEIDFSSLKLPEGNYILLPDGRVMNQKTRDNSDTNSFKFVLLDLTKYIKNHWRHINEEQNDIAPLVRGQSPIFSTSDEGIIFNIPLRSAKLISKTKKLTQTYRFVFILVEPENIIKAHFGVVSNKVQQRS